MADIVKLVPTEGPDADETLKAAMGKYNYVIIIGIDEDGADYETNLEDSATVNWFLDSIKAQLFEEAN